MMVDADRPGQHARLAKRRAANRTAGACVPLVLLFISKAHADVEILRARRVEKSARHHKTNPLRMRLAFGVRRPDAALLVFLSSSNRSLHRSFRRNGFAARCELFATARLRLRRPMCGGGSAPPSSWDI